MIVLDELDKKALDHFRGFVVKKDLVGVIKGGANVPAFVLEYLLANTCSTEDEEKLKEGMEKNGNKPGNKQGSMGSGGMSQQLAQLAAQQEALRKELNKMADQINKDGKGAGSLGKIAEKMEETETDLVNKMLSNETLKRQQEILTRLLESEKAEKEREMDEKRQSNEAKNENFSNPNEFLEYNRMKQKETELLKTVPPSLNPFYKTKVNQYFNNFED